MSSRKRCAFTLVELLVVIAIIGVLVALLLPAVQAAREAARRSQCSNNLKQIGLAIHNYEVSQQTFPPGGLTTGPCCGTQSLTSWAIAILPHLEESALYDRYDLTRTNEDRVNHPVLVSYVGVYHCPADDFRAGTVAVPASGPGADLGVKYHRGSYRAMTGRADGDLPWDGQQQPDVASFPLVREWMGMFPTAGYHELIHVVEPRMVTDGLSKTIMAGEASSVTDSAGENGTRKTLWAYSYTSYNKSHLVPESRYLMGDIERCNEIGQGIGGPNCKRFWGSLHTGGVLHFLFGDGSVRGIPGGVDMFLMAQLATIAGEEPTQITD